MPFLHEHELKKEKLSDQRQRYLCHTDNLMMVVIDFHDGPCTAPDPPHAHPHEQITYVAAGELLVFIGEDQLRLVEGDMFTVPGGVPHSVQPLSAHVRLVDTFTPLRQEFLKQ